MAKINLFTTAKSIKSKATLLNEELNQVDEELKKLGRFVYEKKKEITEKIKEEEKQKQLKLEEQKKQEELKLQEEKRKQEEVDRQQDIKEVQKKTEKETIAKEETETLKQEVEQKTNEQIHRNPKVQTQVQSRPKQNTGQRKPDRTQTNEKNSNEIRSSNYQGRNSDRSSRDPRNRKDENKGSRQNNNLNHSNNRQRSKEVQPTIAEPITKNSPNKENVKANKNHSRERSHDNKRDKRWVGDQEALLSKTQRRINEKKNKNRYRNQNKQVAQTPAPERKKAITMGDFITVKDLSEKIGIQTAQIIKTLMGLGVFATINQELDYDTASLVAAEFSIGLEKKAVKSFEDKLIDEGEIETEEENLEDRPPIVTVMGHVDHGKTSLLDAIRDTDVTGREAGGITQHIGAYTVNHDGNQITFLDTPGHEAFTSMRARGAQVTDIAILVVAANDGIMPQTIEAINHAKQADVPIIVAINKIDLEAANTDRVKQELAEHNLIVEDWGGETIAVPVSALKHEGIDTLLEMIALVAEMQELKANPNRKARGTIIEAQLDKGRGPVATILVEKGTLNIGDSIVAGTAYGRVRAMMNHNGKRVKSAGPSVPVEVLGLSDVPSAGDVIVAVEDDKLAKQVADERANKIKEEQVKRTSKVSLDELFSQIKQGDIQDLNVIVKADVQGSVEAVSQAIEKVSNEEVRVKAIHCGVGGITESDVMLATASNAIIVGFNVRPSANAAALAVKEEVDIHTYRIIYEVIEEIEAAMKGMLAPEYKEVVIGQAEVRTIFKVSGVGTIAGSYVINGKIQRNAKVRILRNDIVINESEMDSLKRFKDDVKEVASGYECGITIANFNDIKEGDIIEAFIMEEITR